MFLSKGCNPAVQCHPKQGASLAPALSLSCHCHQQLFLLKPFISPRSHLITLEVFVSQAAPPPDQTLDTLSATTAPVSHHQQPRTLCTSPGIFPFYSLLMQFICLDISLHRHLFSPSSLHFRLYILGFDPLHQKIRSFFEA